MHLYILLCFNVRNHSLLKGLNYWNKFQSLSLSINSFGGSGEINQLYCFNAIGKNYWLYGRAPMARDIDRSHLFLSLPCILPDKVLDLFIRFELFIKCRFEYIIQDSSLIISSLNHILYNFNISIIIKKCVEIMKFILQTLRFHVKHWYLILTNCCL